MEKLLSCNQLIYPLILPKYMGSLFFFKVESSSLNRRAKKVEKTHTLVVRTDFLLAHIFRSLCYL